jgi:hypothetical protein
VSFPALSPEKREWAEKLHDHLRAREHPAFLLKHAKGVDEKTGEPFEFIVSDEARDAQLGWSWQRDILDWWMEYDKTCILKARQLGVTWLASGLALWFLLYRPGTKVLAVSINEEDASKVVNRAYDQYLSLPALFRNGVVQLKPTRGARPYNELQFRHPSGQISTMLALPSTKKAGHGQTAALVILDEFSRQEYARDTWKAVIPTMADGGRVLIISTANGVSNDITGEGNFYHHAWVHADEYGLDTKFLRWDLHPDRDEDWYRTQASALPTKDRAEQYPRDELEAFILTGDVYFDADALSFYAKKKLKEPLYRAQFTSNTPTRATLNKKTNGWIHVFEEPGYDVEVVGEAHTQRTKKKYAIGCDVSTGRGYDYSCAYVIDLSTMALVAELHAKLDADQLAEQLHFLGRWYNDARIAVEVAGGYGDAVIVNLRDGREGRPAYPKLYRHRQFARGDQPEAKPFGFPTNAKTRPLILEHMTQVLREHSLPYVGHGLIQECQTFTYAKTTPSPRAQEGCNDDRVMACAITLEMYRQFGHYAERTRKRSTRKTRLDYFGVNEEA